MAKKNAETPEAPTATPPEAPPPANGEPAAPAAPGEPPMSLTVKLPPEHVRRIRTHSYMHGQTTSDIVAQLIAAHIPEYAART